jgi:transcriptional regulator with XRE-family HTH domain
MASKPTKIERRVRALETTLKAEKKARAVKFLRGSKQKEPNAPLSVDEKDFVGKLGAKLRRMRIQSGFSLPLLAERCREQGTRVTDDTLFNYEQGKGAPKATILRRLAQIYNVPLGVLLGDQHSAASIDDLQSKLAEAVKGLTPNEITTLVKYANLLKPGPKPGAKASVQDRDQHRESKVA